MIALLAAAALVPAAQGALVVEDASGIRALLTAAAQYAPSLSPDAIGQSVANSVGVDLLAEAPRWGLGRGPRVLAFARGTLGLSAPVANPRAAAAALESWRKARPDRFGRVAGKRLYTASGRGAAEMLGALQHPQPLPRPLAASASGPAWAFVRLPEPLREAVLRIDASGQGLVAAGTVTAADAILAGHAPEGCAGSPPACLRAGLGPAGRGALEVLLQHLGMPAQPGLRGASRVEERLDSIDARRLDALRPSPVFDGPDAAGPALAGAIDLAQADRAISLLSPLDALQSPVTAGAWAAHLLYGPLLRHAGPLTLSGDPLPAGAAHVELRLPLR